MKSFIVFSAVVVAVIVVRAAHLRGDEPVDEFRPFDLREDKKKCNENGQKCKFSWDCCSAACSSDNKCEEPEHKHLHFG
uniref:U37-Theraphotoxin-Sfo1a_1 n=1 Tax=Selenotholus foelschei TaxID=1905327 RepID=A0A482ZAV1_9ARAC